MLDPIPDDADPHAATSPNGHVYVREKGKAGYVKGRGVSGQISEFVLEAGRIEAKTLQEELVEVRALRCPPTACRASALAASDALPRLFSCAHLLGRSRARTWPSWSGTLASA